MREFAHRADQVLEDVYRQLERIDTETDESHTQKTAWGGIERLEEIKPLDVFLAHKGLTN